MEVIRLKTCVLACRMLENELKASMAAAGTTYPVFWLSGTLHNSPRRLHEALADRLEPLGDYDRVILTYGLCGGAAEGLRSAGQELILPRVDDCVALLLGSQQRRDILGRTGQFFITRGWMTGERSLEAEYNRALTRYGEAAGKRIIRAMFANYRTLTLLDTGCEPLAALLPEVGRLAALLELEVSAVPAVLSYLTELLTGPWTPEKFLVVPPGQAVTGAMLRAGHTSPENG